MTLADALAERVDALARAKERLLALDDQTITHVVQEPDSDAVLRQALAAVGTPERLDIARRLLQGEDVTASPEIAGAGLAVWDPVSDSMRPTDLLIELMKVVDR